MSPQTKHTLGKKPRETHACPGLSHGRLRQVRPLGATGLHHQSVQEMRLPERLVAGRSFTSSGTCSSASASTCTSACACTGSGPSAGSRAGGSTTA